MIRHPCARAGQINWGPVGPCSVKGRGPSSSAKFRVLVNGACTFATFSTSVLTACQTSRPHQIAPDRPLPSHTAQPRSPSSVKMGQSYNIFGKQIASQYVSSSWFSLPSSPPKAPTVFHISRSIDEPMLTLWLCSWRWVSWAHYSAPPMPSPAAARRPPPPLPPSTPRAPTRPTSSSALIPLCPVPRGRIPICLTRSTGSSLSRPTRKRRRRRSTKSGRAEAWVRVARLES